MASSAFVKATDTFTTPLFIGTDPVNDVLVLAAGERQVLEVLKAKDIEEHKITFRFPKYKDNVDAVDSATELVNGKFNFKASMLRFTRMVKLIKAWTFTDESGEPVPVNETTVASLHPLIASAIGDEMEKVIGLI